MKNGKRTIALLLVLAMMISMMGICPAMAAEDTVQGEAEAAAVSIYPVPQGITADSTEGMKLTGTVDIVVHGEQDEATLPKLEALLDAHGVTYQQADSVGSNAAIILAVKCAAANCDICVGIPDSEGALDRQQGYVLQSSDAENTNGQITIVGADADGAYYGVMSLIQLFDQKTADGRIAEVTVSDYPDVEFRGYVEGFYGYPWSHEDRAQLFVDTTVYKMTTYIYAPKDDPYHRGSWRTLYPEEEANNIKELAQIAAANNMEFVWTIHPGADYDSATDADGDGLADDYEILLSKFDQVYSLGVRQFGIFYDDLDYDVADGVEHATVINDSYAYLKDKYGDVKPFVTVVTRYTNSWGADWDTYFKPFMQNVHEDTLVLWTGNHTMSAITKAYMEVPKTKTGVDRDFGVWWNYPVNDYTSGGRGHLFMQSLDCLDNDVDNIASFFLNPMPDADASKVAIFSGADYAWNVGAFDSKTSWSRAIKELVPEANEEFERFADHLGYVDKGNGFFFDESVYMKEDLAAFEAARASGEDLAKAASTLKAKFSQMASDTEALRKISNPGLLDEISVFVDAYEDLANAGVAMMEAYQLALAGSELAVGKAEESAALLTKAQSYKDAWKGGSKTVKVGSYRVVPFLQTLVDAGVMDLMLQNGGMFIGERMISNVQGLDLSEVTVADGTYSLPDITAAMKQGDYIGIGLPRVENINQISVEVEPAANFKVQYSLNGIEWCDYEALTEDFVTAAYARVLCTQDTEEAVVSGFSILGAAEVTATTEMDIYKTYVMANAVDKNYSTWAWVYNNTTGKPGPYAGDYVQLDLGTVMPLNDITAYFGTNLQADGDWYLDSFLEMQLQTSLDGVTWTPVGDTVLRDDCTVVNELLIVNMKGDGKPARYVRLVEMQDNVNWVKLYELEYNQGISGTVTTNMTVSGSNAAANAMDGKLETCFLSDGAVQAEDYIQVTFGSAFAVSDLAVYFGRNADGSAAGLPAMDIQVSEDGSVWTTAKSLTASDYEAVGDKYLADVQLDDVITRYVRLTATQAGDAPVQVQEICFNGISDSNVVRFADEQADALGNFYPDSDYVNRSTVDIAQTNYLDDGDLNTVAQIYGVKQGDVLIYPTSISTDVDYVVIYQDANAISNAQVSVLDLEGNWTDVGTLSGDYNELAVDKQILAVKLTFDGTVLPMIKEISLKKVRELDEEVAAVEALIDAIGEVTLEKEAAITQARESYNALSENQKYLIVNYETLTAAEAALAELKANSVNDAVVAAQAAQAAAEAAQAKAEEAQAAAEAAKAEAEAAKAAAETAQTAAEAAKAEAETAKADAEEAAAAAAQDKTAAEAAQAAAEAAQTKAEEAQAKAEAAQTAAETAETNAETAETNAVAAKTAAETAQANAEAAQAAAEQSNTEAAAEAARAAEEAAKAADEAAKAATESGKAAEEAGKAAASASAAAASASESAGSAADAAEAAKDAQEAQAAAEAAQAAAEAARKAAEEEKKAAEEAAKKAEEEKAAAEAAQAAAAAEKAAAEAAQKAAEEAQAAAEAAKAAAEEAVLQAAKYQAALSIDAYVKSVDQSGYGKEQIEALAQAVSDAKAAIEAAETVEEIASAVDAAKTAIDAIETADEDVTEDKCPSEAFTDVAADGWYHEAVDYMIENGYMNGMSDTLFGVDGSVTRGQLVTILYRIAGEPAVTAENPFTDVEAGQWYTDAVIWAAGEGIVNGVTETAFAPAQNITREQLVTMFWRYAGAPEGDAKALEAFTDIADVSAYAVEAMAWAVENGIVSGVTENTLVPGATATRAQISVIVQRFAEK